MHAITNMLHLQHYYGNILLIKFQQLYFIQKLKKVYIYEKNIDDATVI